MTLSGMNHASHKIQHHRQAHAQTQAHQAQAHTQTNVAPVDVPMMQGEMERDWTALGVLAEVSRHFDLNEKSDGPPANAPAAGHSNPQTTTERFEVQEQLTGDPATPSREVSGEKQSKPMENKIMEKTIVN